jgi:hypothetical protein
VDFFTFFLPIFILFTGSENDQRAAEEKARERRLKEHRMNARLLRLNI